MGNLVELNICDWVRNKFFCTFLFVCAVMSSILMVVILILNVQESLLTEFDFREPRRISRLPQDVNLSLPLLREDKVSQDLSVNTTSPNVTCMKKVMMVETIEWDYEEKCQHVPGQSCYQTYETGFKPNKVEKCKETFLKDCFITYKEIAKSKTVEVCDDQFKRDCDSPDRKEVCSYEYNTVCKTDYKEYEVEDDVPNCRVMKVPWCKKDPKTGEENKQMCITVTKNVCSKRTELMKKKVPYTSCDSPPIKVCGPEACPIRKGERICREEVRHFVQKVPEEECKMTPKRSCQDEITMVPDLVPNDRCVDVPREVCSMEKVNPRKVRKPVVKTWCGEIGTTPTPTPSPMTPPITATFSPTPQTTGDPCVGEGCTGATTTGPSTDSTTTTTTTTTTPRPVSQPPPATCKVQLQYVCNPDITDNFEITMPAPTLPTIPSVTDAFCRRR